MQWNNEFVFV